MPIDSIDITGLRDGIRSCFSSVFSELNIATEAWYQEKRLLTTGRDNFADFISRQVGVFPLFGTSRSASIDNSYVTLRISRDIERIRYKNLEDIEERVTRERRGLYSSKEGQSQSLPPLDALNSTESGFALVGNSGSGKTTVFRHLAVEAARGRAIRGRRVIPVYLAVKDVSENGNGLLDAASDLLQKLEIPEYRRVLTLLLREGRCLLLLDGLDETNPDHQRQLIRELGSILAQYPKSILCISARPLSLEVGLAGFEKWETLPLLLEQRLLFVKKWFSVVNSEKGDRLALQCQRDPALLDLGSSPLMLSIVCALYENDLDIPKEQDELYSRCIEGLLGGWDAFRNIARNSPLAPLSIRKRITFITWIGAMLFEAEKVVFSPGDLEVLQIIAKVSNFLRTPALPEDIVLSSLYNDFGLLSERGPSKYSFSHLSLHEYATARYYVENRKENELIPARFRDARWQEVLRLVIRLLPNADDFMTRVSQVVKLHQLADAEQLENLLAGRPAMSLPVRIRIYRMVAQKISGALSEPALEISIADNILIVKHAFKGGWQGAVQKARKIEVEEKKLRESNEKARHRKRATKYQIPSQLLMVVNCLGPLLRLLSSSGVLQEIKLDSSLLRLWEAAGWPEIRDALLLEANEGLD